MCLLKVDHCSRRSEYVHDNPWYMIFIIGTLDLFPVMDAVFSPIRGILSVVGRQFESQAEAEECVLKPCGVLESMIRSHYSKTRHFGLWIAGSSRRVPTKFLIFHFLFRDLQQGSREEISFSRCPR